MTPLPHATANRPTPHMQHAFIFGPPRSGTTLVAFLLAAEPAWLALSEPLLAHAALPPWKLHRFFGHFQRTHGLQRVKPPHGPDPDRYWRFLEQLARANGRQTLLLKETFRSGPELGRLANETHLAELARGAPRTALLIRHPLDTVASTLRFQRYLCGLTGRLVRLRFPHLPHFATRRALLEWAAGNWVRFAHWTAGLQHEVFRYEDLARDPEREWPRWCATLGVPVRPPQLALDGRPRVFGGLGDPAVFRSPPRRITGRAAGLGAGLSALERERVWSLCGPAAERFGYERPRSAAQVSSAAW